MICGAPMLTFCKLHGSYSSLGRDFKTMFEELLKHINAQNSQANMLREQLLAANSAAIEAKTQASARLQIVLAEERQQAAEDRQNLLSQITSLITSQGEVQEARLATKIDEVRAEVDASKEVFVVANAQYVEAMDEWNIKENGLVEEVVRSRETLKSKLKDDWMVCLTCERPLTIKCVANKGKQAANKYNASIQTTTKSVHEETIRIVDEQMKDIHAQMQALDDFVARARAQNAKHHDDHALSLQSLSTTVKGSYGNIGEHFAFTYDRIKELGEEMSAKTAVLEEALSPLDTTLRQPLAELRSSIASSALQEYTPTGETPQKVQYQYPTVLPRTEAHETLLAALRRPAADAVVSAPVSPSKQPVFQDTDMIDSDDVSNTPVSEMEKPLASLREVDLNISAGSRASESAIPSFGTTSDDMAPPPMKRAATATGMKLPKMLKKPSVVTLEGRENSQVPVFAQSSGRRRSPRHG
jgi:kinesin family protein 11